MIDDQGQMLGVMSTQKAVSMAHEKGFDLVEVSPTAVPPVCKFLDYGKYKFELQKKMDETKKKQKIQVLKEIQIRPSISKNDLEVKKKALKKFLDDDCKIRFVIRFRGREITNIDAGKKIIADLENEMQEVANFEKHEKPDERQISMIITPKKGASS